MTASASRPRRLREMKRALRACHTEEVCSDVSHPQLRVLWLKSQADSGLRNVGSDARDGIRVPFARHCANEEHVRAARASHFRWYEAAAVRSRS